ncbi:MAG: hypothetical protein J0H42_25440 [Rhizobiales bacterium]|nr:hypothetical protein [Hyphomicrobiales bacterium]
MNLDRKVKTALNETRLLLLGAQVLLGFQFQAFFQDGFSELSAISRHLCLTGLVLVLLSVTLLVMPSMQHRLVEMGQSSERLVSATSALTGLGLVPLAFSLALGVHVVVDRHFGMLAGIVAGVALGAACGLAWFGIEYLIDAPARRNIMPQSATPLGTRIEQLLTEARVIIPGAQALFGFQILAMLTSGFDRLPQASKVVHLTALILVATNMVLLMMPAALHRLTFGGDDSTRFLRIGSGIVIVAPIFLAAGISAESYVVFQRVIGSEGRSAIGAAATFFVIAACWYAVPLLIRSLHPAKRPPQEAATAQTRSA